MGTKVLLDTNILVRFLTRDHEEHYLKSIEIFKSIESGEIDALVPNFIIAEVVYVLKRIYKVETEKIAHLLKKILMYEHIYTDNHLITLEALDIYANKNIDFADALLCAKKNLEGYEVISFDKDIAKC